MGQSESSPYDDKHKPLYAQKVFEPTIHRRFIKDRLVTIELEDHFWTKPRSEIVELKDERSGQVLFKLPVQDGDPATKHQRKQLLDAFGVPVVGLEWTNQPPTNAEYVITTGGSEAHSQELYRFETLFTHFTKPIEMVLNKDSTTDCTMLYVMGFWLARQAVVGIKRGVSGAVHKIAQFNAVGSVDNPKYQLVVAPGVDIALMLLFAAAMDEQVRLHETHNERVAVKHARKLEKRREKKASANGSDAPRQAGPTVVRAP